MGSDQLTFPFPLRFLLAVQPEALTQVVAVVQRGISTFVVQHSGLAVSSGARTGAVTLIQRFGSALNLNPHLQMLFLDGAYVFRGQRPIFHRARRPGDNELHQLLDTLSRRIVSGSKAWNTIPDHMALKSYLGMIATELAKDNISSASHADSTLL